MAINPLKTLLFAGGGIVVVTGAAYVSGALDPYLHPVPPAEIAALDPAAPREPAPAVTAPGTEGRVPATDPGANAMAPAAPGSDADAMTPAAPVPATPGTPATLPAKAGIIAPTFDVVRVEGDGSIVIAGSAAPSAKVEIVNGSIVLGSTTAGPDGSFAIVLDDPLEPGDYQIVLRSTTPDNIAAASEQTAVVSVPEKPGGQILAMVEEPGKPAQLLTVPEPDQKAGASGSAATGQAAVQAPSAPGGPTAPAPAPAGQDGAPAETTPAAAGTTPAAAPTVVPATPRIVVEAVEIDGRKIFVAGLADAGRKLRAYANDILLGDAQASPDGHFLVEATRDIPVGTYTIHVDALGADGAKVVARAAVPFEREPGEAIAAVAPPAAPPASGSTTLSAPEATASKLVPAEPGAVSQGPASQGSAAVPAQTQPGTVAEAPSATTSPATEPASPPAVAAVPAGEQASQPPADVAAATPPAEVPETTAPKLEHADGAVIIRRHDTLWRISRRVYGHGVRYSTIYLANQNQIRDPDRIWPGQVFTVPERSKEGESADLKAMGDQMTTTPSRTE